VEGELSIDNYRPLLHNPAKQFTFRGIKPDQTFSLELIPRPPHAQVSPVVLSITALWLLLGGLGKRSRRGFGTLRLQKDVDSLPLKLDTYRDVEAFENVLLQTISEALKEVQNYISTLRITPALLSNPPAFPILHANHTKILLCKKPFPTWEDAMRTFWNLLRSNPYRGDPVFGFAGSAGRQASPLHLRIVKIGDKYHLLMTAFRSRFAGSSPNWRKLQDFLSDCCQKWQGTWIMGGSATW
jgi:hypothetical protein